MGVRIDPNGQTGSNQVGVEDARKGKCGWGAHRQVAEKKSSSGARYGAGGTSMVTTGGGASRAITCRTQHQSISMQ
eukprot:1800123-Rhodomonas_salina.1